MGGYFTGKARPLIAELANLLVMWRFRQVNAANWREIAALSGTLGSSSV
jgi:hypothetical protein